LAAQVTEGRNNEVRRLVAAERPLTARSVVASTLLGITPPELAGQVLVRSGELFGISEGTTRVAISRMVRAGELVANDGADRPGGHLIDRQARQRASRQPRFARWDGQWRVAIVVGGARTPGERARLRTFMARARMGERREGVWMRPSNIEIAADATCDWFD